jgi:hypothetical protein
LNAVHIACRTDEGRYRRAVVRTRRLPRVAAS